MSVESWSGYVRGKLWNLSCQVLSKLHSTYSEYLHLKIAVVHWLYESFIIPAINPLIKLWFRSEIKKKISWGFSKFYGSIHFIRNRNDKSISGIARVRYCKVTQYFTTCCFLFFNLWIWNEITIGCLQHLNVHISPVWDICVGLEK